MTIPISIRCFFLLLYKIMAIENDMKCWNTVDFIKCNKISVCSSSALTYYKLFFFWFYNQNSNTASHLDTFEMYLPGQKQLIDNISEANNMMIDWRKNKNKSEKNGVEDISSSMRFHRMFNCAPFQQNVCTKWNFCMFRRSSMIFYR